MRIVCCFFTLAVFFSTNNIFCFESLQNNDLDSIFYYINSLPDDSSKVIELTDLSYKYTKVQLDTAFILGQRALELSEELNFEYGIAKSLFQLGLVLRYQSNYDKAIEYSNKS